MYFQSIILKLRLKSWKAISFSYRWQTRATWRIYGERAANKSSRWTLSVINLRSS